MKLSFSYFFSNREVFFSSLLIVLVLYRCIVDGRIDTDKPHADNKEETKEEEKTRF